MRRHSDSKDSSNVNHSFLFGGNMRQIITRELKKDIHHTIHADASKYTTVIGVYDSSEDHMANNIPFLPIH
jgi:hypothetical protein